MFVELMGEKGDRMSLARDHLSLCPTLLLLPMVLGPGGGSGLRCLLSGQWVGSPDGQPGPWLFHDDFLRSLVGGRGMGEPISGLDGS